MNSKKLHYFIISIFISLYVVVSAISTIHVIEFFKLSNPEWLAIFLAVAFEIGAAASLASVIVLEKMNKNLVWVLILVLTFMQVMGNTYYAFDNLENFESWSQLFGLEEEEQIFQKRILSLISGAILPLVALGFIKSLVDYIRPDEKDEEKKTTPSENHEKESEQEKENYQNFLEVNENKIDFIIDGGITNEQKNENSEVIVIPIESNEEEEKIETTLEEKQDFLPELPEKNTKEVEIVKIENTNSNRPKLQDRPSPQVDPTLL